MKNFQKALFADEVGLKFFARAGASWEIPDNIQNEELQNEIAGKEAEEDYDSDDSWDYYY